MTSTKTADEIPHTAIMPRVAAATSPVEAIVPGFGPKTVDPAPVAASEVISVDTETPQRPIAAKDWAIASLAGLGYALLAVLSGAYFEADVGSLVLLGLAGFGLGLLAWLDHLTQLILNKHNLVFGGVAVAAIAVVAIINGSWGIGILAVAGGAGAFMFMLALAVTKMGFVGGGDIKLAPIPAALLAAWNPLAPVLWLFCTFVFCLGAMVVNRLRKKPLQSTAMAPYMALAIIPTVLGAGAVMAAAGI